MTNTQKNTMPTRSTSDTGDRGVQSTDDKRLLRGHPDFDHVADLRRHAKNKRHYDQIVTFMDRMDTEEEAKKMMAKTTDGLKIIDDMIGDDEELKDLCEQATINAHVAQLIYDARVEALMGTIIVTTIYPTTKSENPCPVCDGKEWLPYHYEVLSGDFKVIELNPTCVQYFSAAVDTCPDDGYWLDECLGCGIGICTYGDSDEEEEVSPHPELGPHGSGQGEQQDLFEWSQDTV